ncbi:hypothetical protein [uncultured Leptotrichia sp.]|uniref:hypothetical protein n=1 Tax=uncultured Leptotrichia sp. TaxID=159271 RepID=UPI0025EAFF09|nr:hypothetical protein [uncultured Leptotrichia sp.]
MRKLGILLLINLLIPIVVSSQTISKNTYPKILGDSIVLITPEQLKETNLIFNEHNLFKAKVPLLERKIQVLTEINDNHSKIDSLRVQEINQYKANVDKLKKSIKTKNTLITGISSGFVVSLLLLLFK